MLWKIKETEYETEYDEYDVAMSDVLLLRREKMPLAWTELSVQGINVSTEHLKRLAL